ncbi:hypothetical protein L195_g064423, partial [Trifolium pratense]
MSSGIPVTHENGSTLTKIAFCLCQLAAMVKMCPRPL